MDNKRTAMAESLVGKEVTPDGYRIWRAFATEAQAYHVGSPYPEFSFRGWRKEERGPLPLVMPFVQSIPRKAAQWLFGRPIDITCEDEAFQDLIVDAWADSRMDSRMVAAAETGAVMGKVGVKFDYDETREGCPLRFRIIQPWMMRTYHDPHDQSAVLMVRIQYPYRDYNSGQLMMYREDWTDKTHAVYEPVPVTSFYAWDSPDKRFGSSGAPDDDDLRAQKTELKYTKKPNPFGVIPVIEIHNIDRGRGYGTGDLWGMYRIIDRINLAYALHDRHNQKNVDPHLLLIDLEAASDDAPQVLAPGEGIQLASTSERTGKAEQLTTDAAIRPHIRQYAEDLLKMLLDAVGSVIVDEEKVTNKGNLTQAVMTQMYAPLVLSTEEKRKAYGHDGLTRLFDAVAQGLANYKGALTNKDVSKAVAGFDPKDPESLRCVINWPDYFDATDEDKQARLTRYTTEVGAGFMPHDEAAKRIALMEGCEDTEDYLANLPDPTELPGMTGGKQSDAEDSPAKRGEEKPAK